MPMRPFARLFPIDWNDRKLHRYFCILVPLLCGLYSWWLGQDCNWDLRNYHRYSPFALLNGKLTLDLAPAGIRTYFNPALDLLYYWMTRYWTAPLAGLVMGFIHGLIFPLLLGIARAVCSGLPEGDQNRVPLLLALAGMLTVGFLTSVGNSMGDISSALPVLAALCLVTQHWDRLHADARATMGPLLLAGVLAGAGAGLKLTNMVYALSMCSALVMLPTSWRNRLSVITWFGIAVLIGLAISAGYWFWLMWTRFGNPLFPMFGSVFPTPLAPAGLDYDINKMPQSALQALFWPILLTLDHDLVSEVRLDQLNWALVYLLFIDRGVLTIIRKINGGIPSPVPRHSPGDYLLAHLALGFVLWMACFSIYRYLVTIEVLTPLAIWLLLNRMLPCIQARSAALCAIVVSTEYTIFSTLFLALISPAKLGFLSPGGKNAMLIILLVAGFRTTRLLPDAPQRRVAHLAIVFSTMVVLFGGIKDWEHAGWAENAFSVSVPPLSDPAHTTVLLTHEPMAWIVPDFPATVAFALLDSGFPQTAQYVRKVHTMIESRRGPAYIIVDTWHPGSVDNIDAVNRSLSHLGLLQNPSLCKFLARYPEHLELNWVQHAEDGRRCELTHATLLPESNQQRVAQSGEIAKKFGLRLDQATCTTFKTYIGDQPFPYQWCRVFPVMPRNGLRL